MARRTSIPESVSSPIPPSARSSRALCSGGVSAFSCATWSWTSATAQCRCPAAAAASLALMDSSVGSKPTPRRCRPPGQQLQGQLVVTSGFVGSGQGHGASPARTLACRAVFLSSAARAWRARSAAEPRAWSGRRRPGIGRVSEPARREAGRHRRPRRAARAGMRSRPVAAISTLLSTAARRPRSSVSLSVSTTAASRECATRRPATAAARTHERASGSSWSRARAAARPGCRAARGRPADPAAATSSSAKNDVSLRPFDDPRTARAEIGFGSNTPTRVRTSSSGRGSRCRRLTAGSRAHSATAARNGWRGEDRHFGRRRQSRPDLKTGG